MRVQLPFAIVGENLREVGEIITDSNHQRNRGFKRSSSMHFLDCILASNVGFVAIRLKSSYS